VDHSSRMPDATPPAAKTSRSRTIRPLSSAASARRATGRLKADRLSPDAFCELGTTEARARSARVPIRRRTAPDCNKQRFPDVIAMVLRPRMKEVCAMPAPFTIAVQDAVLADLRARLAVSRLPAAIGNDDWDDGTAPLYL